MVSTLSLEIGSSRRVEFDLGQPHGVYFDGAELTAYGGNIYLFIDGREYGSLFISHECGRPVITLGRFDSDEGEWVEANPVTGDTALDAEVAVNGGGV